MKREINRRDDIVLVDRYVPGSLKISVSNMHNDIKRKPASYAVIVDVFATVDINFTKEEESQSWNSSLNDAFAGSMRAALTDGLTASSSRTFSVEETWAQVQTKTESDTGTIIGSLQLKFPASSMKTILSLADVNSALRLNSGTLEETKAVYETKLIEALKKADVEYAAQSKAKQLAMAAAHVANWAAQQGRERTDYEGKKKLLRASAEEAARVALGEFVTTQGEFVTAQHNQYEKYDAEMRGAIGLLLADRELISSDWAMHGADLSRVFFQKWLEEQKEEGEGGTCR